jgi:uncharacterized membrane protein SpoIIM required for sporulation
MKCYETVFGAFVIVIVRVVTWLGLAFVFCMFVLYLCICNGFVFGILPEL